MFLMGINLDIRDGIIYVSLTIRPLPLITKYRKLMKSKLVIVPQNTSAK